MLSGEPEKEPVRLAFDNPKVTFPALIGTVSAMAPVEVLKNALSPFVQVEPVQLASVVFQFDVEAPLFQVRSAA